MALLKADQKMIKLYEFCKQFTCVFVHLTSYLVHTVIIFCFLFVDITLSFTMSSYNVLESNGLAQPVLRLSQAVYCCFTISVWVYVEEIEARRKCILQHVYYFAVICKNTFVSCRANQRIYEKYIPPNSQSCFSIHFYSA